MRVTTNDYCGKATLMQPSDSQLTGVPQSVIIDPNTGLPDNVIIIEQPSSGPKIIGIFVMIWGALGILSEVFSLGDNVSNGGMFIAFSVANLGISVGFIVGGYMISNYEQRGIHLSLLMIIVSVLIGMAVLVLMPGLIEEIVEEENLSSEEEEVLEGEMGLIAGIGMIFVIVCNGICGLIIAIPMMISNNGLDDSSLFGGWF